MFKKLLPDILKTLKWAICGSLFTLIPSVLALKFNLGIGGMFLLCFIEGVIIWDMFNVYKKRYNKILIVRLIKYIKERR